MNKILLTTTLISLLSITHAQDFITYTEDDLPYKVNLPKSWYGVQIPGPAGVNLTPAQKAPYLPLIRLTYIPKAAEIDNLTKASKIFETEMKDGGTVKKLGAKNTTYGKQKGIENEYSVIANKEELRVRLWLSIGNKYVYAFQLIDKPGTYTKNKDNVFTKILESIEFK